MIDFSNLCGVIPALLNKDIPIPVACFRCTKKIYDYVWLNYDIISLFDKFMWTDALMQWFTHRVYSRNWLGNKVFLHLKTLSELLIFAHNYYRLPTETLNKMLGIFNTTSQCLRSMFTNVSCITVGTLVELAS